ncbi:hypothetical protein P7K49_003776 [Saguinus oedipus]|uniref:Uncharacterized protein n=1 Tax=Saguinus oedipus TaxID=9490 RepID=A0ABQ9W5Y5_SAGOE|nr:hypothetical protein P7K49_003776 [Saguinus oedipus]
MHWRWRPRRAALGHSPQQQQHQEYRRQRSQARGAPHGEHWEPGSALPSLLRWSSASQAPSTGASHPRLRPSCATHTPTQVLGAALQLRSARPRHGPPALDRGTARVGAREDRCPGREPLGLARKEMLFPR